MRDAWFRSQTCYLAAISAAFILTACGRSFSPTPAAPAPEATPTPTTNAKPSFNTKETTESKASDVLIRPLPVPMATPISLPQMDLGSQPNETPSKAPTTRPQPNTEEPRDQSTPTAKPWQSLVVDQKMTVYQEAKGILEPVATLPAQSIIELARDYNVQNLPHRDANKRLKYSTTGFISPIRLVSIAGLSETRIHELNTLEGGLYISASFLQSVETDQGDFAPLTHSTAGEEFLSVFEASGKPKFSYPAGLQRRFGERVNTRAVQQSPETKTKYKKVMDELVRAVSRAEPSPRELMMMNRTLARFHSQEFERSGLIASGGAWSISVSVTAVRRGFANTPCAEFASEVIRQAYNRAGYALTDDFSKEKKNQLIWHQTASVRGLSRALFNAGWVVWSTDDYRPPVGAVMLNGTGNSPGHVFFAAGADGKWVVDNGSPHGRDLLKTKLKTLKNLYKAGAFMLPPGINPEPWP